MSIGLCAVIIIFLLGLIFYARTGNRSFVEGLHTDREKTPRCPNLLIQKDKEFYLYNSKLAKVPGVNPLKFENLEEYVEFLDWQRSQGIRCPVLYLQQIFDAQGNPVYKVRPSVSELQGGLPPSISRGPNHTLLIDSTRNDAPYNQNSYPAYDPTSFYVGTTTPLDTQVSQQSENMLYSPDPMDDNWGGHKYTQSLVDQGVYAGNEVKLRV
jgi:hypothetical protein